MVAALASGSPNKQSSSPKRARLSWHEGLHRTTAVPKASGDQVDLTGEGEDEGQGMHTPKQSPSVLDELFCSTKKVAPDVAPSTPQEECMVCRCSLSACTCPPNLHIGSKDCKVCGFMKCFCMCPRPNAAAAESMEGSQSHVLARKQSDEDLFTESSEVEALHHEAAMPTQKAAGPNPAVKAAMVEAAAPPPPQGLLTWASEEGGRILRAKARQQAAEADKLVAEAAKPKAPPAGMVLPAASLPKIMETVVPSAGSAASLQGGFLREARQLAARADQLAAESACSLEGRRKLAAEAHQLAAEAMRSCQGPLVPPPKVAETGFAAAPKANEPEQAASKQGEVKPAQALEEASSASQDLMQEDADAATAADGGTADAAAAARQAKEKIRKCQKPEKYFQNIMLPKLQNGDPADINGHLADWAPERLRIIKAAMRNPTYEALRVESKSIKTTYDLWTVMCVAEHRAAEGVRIMLKMKDPYGKVQQTGSYVFPMGGDGCCSKHAYLYLDMLRLLSMLSEHERALPGMLKEWHSNVRTYMDFMFAED